MTKGITKIHTNLYVCDKKRKQWIHYGFQAKTEYIDFKSLKQLSDTKKCCKKNSSFQQQTSFKMLWRASCQS